MLLLHYNNDILFKNLIIVIYIVTVCTANNYDYMGNIYFILII